MNWIVIGVVFVGIALAMIVFLMASRPATILYALALVISLVGINIHIGFTIYFSRIILFLFFLVVILRLAMDRQGGIHLQVRSSLIILLGLILLEHFISVLLSPRLADGLRQIYIYAGLIAIFFVVLVVSPRAEIIVKAIKLYISMGIVQGLYGIYQVIGAAMNWPTYQTLMPGIPRANDRTVDGYDYSALYDAFRATGFFPADPSHYAGYMCGVLLLSISILAYNRRSLLAYLAIITGGAGLILSLSRSGMIAFVVFGLPTVSFLLWRSKAFAKRIWQQFIITCCLLIVVSIGAIFFIDNNPMKINLPNVLQIMGSRLEDIVTWGVSESESMGIHMATRLMALDALSSSPLLGVGLGVTASPWYSESSGEVWAGAHSHHLDILGQTGILGACLEWLFMGLVGIYMWGGLKKRCYGKEERALLSGLLASYITILLGNFLYHYFLLDYVWFLMGCGVALSREVRRAQFSTAKAYPKYSASFAL